MKLRYIVSVLLIVGLAATPVLSAEAPRTPNELSNNVTWGGYYEFEYSDKESISGDAGHGNFDVHRTILFFGVQPHERLRFFNELEIEHGSEFVGLEQSWLEFAINDNHNLRAGIDLIPVGRLNLKHDGNLRDFVFRPQMDGTLIPTTWYESGIGFNGSIGKNISYQVGISNGLNSADTEALGDVSEFEAMIEDGGNLSEADGNGSKAYWGRFVYSPMLGTDLAVSGYQTKYNAASSSQDNEITFAAFDFSHTQGPWDLKGEYVTVDKDQQSGPGAGGSTVNGLKGGSGGYLEVGYHFFPSALYNSFIARGFDNPTFTALARYEDLTFDEASSGAQTAERDYSYTSLGINYRPVE
ncbi:MAG: hypothetical protein ABEK50_06585, partial [bacterium]